MYASLRLSLASILLFALTLAGALTVHATPAETAKESLSVALNKVLEILKDPAYADATKRQAMRKDIGTIVRSKFDFLEFSQRTVGQRWQSFTQQQKTAFADAFAELLIQTYVNKIDGYNGEQVAFTGEKVSSKGDRVEILTVVTLKSAKKIPVAYRMLPKGGDWKVYDVLIENISLVKNYRTQFQDLLKTSAPEVVIDRIRAKAVEVSNAKQAQGSK